MSDASNDPARVETPTLTGMARAVLVEIAARLTAFVETGAPSAIGLTSIPLTRADREELKARLGRGEVAAAINSAGHTEIWETAYCGVWFVRHYGDGERIAAETIEIAAAPAILAGHPEDRRAAAARLAQDLRETAPFPSGA